MRLILGGYANGRTVYAMQKYQLTAQDCFDASRLTLDGLAGTAADSARGIFDGTLADRGERPRRGNSALAGKMEKRCGHQPGSGARTCAGRTGTAPVS